MTEKQDRWEYAYHFLGISQEVVKKRCWAESCAGGPQGRFVCCRGGLGWGVDNMWDLSESSGGAHLKEA